MLLEIGALQVWITYLCCASMDSMLASAPGSSAMTGISQNSGAPSAFLVDQVQRVHTLRTVGKIAGHAVANQRNSFHINTSTVQFRRGFMGLIMKSGQNRKVWLSNVHPYMAPRIGSMGI
jgi:hypothetical protein